MMGFDNRSGSKLLTINTLHGPEYQQTQQMGGGNVKVVRNGVTQFQGPAVGAANSQGMLSPYKKA